MSDKITPDELSILFGTHIPLDVIMALEHWRESPESKAALRVYLEIRAKFFREEEMPIDFHKPVRYRGIIATNSGTPI